jgi:hypothetical protein
LNRATSNSTCSSSHKRASVTAPSVAAAIAHGAFEPLGNGRGWSIDADPSTSRLTA